MCELGRSPGEDGYHHRALPYLLESVALLQQQRNSRDCTWAQIFSNAGGAVAQIYKTLGRVEEAADLAEQCVEVARLARKMPLRTVAVAVMLVQLCLDLGRFERAVEVGRETEQLLDRAKAGLDGANPLMVQMNELVDWPVLCATLAAAFEGLGRMEECWTYHRGPGDDVPRGRNDRQLYCRTTAGPAAGAGRQAQASGGGAAFAAGGLHPSPGEGRRAYGHMCWVAEHRESDAAAGGRLAAAWE